MTPRLHTLARPLREHGPALLADVPDPHDELLALVWGPRFDRQHALGLWARLSRRQPLAAVHTLPALLSAADRFDDLDRTSQQRLRRLIVRHRALSVAA